MPIKSLRRPLLQDHQFAIPKLQRNFVWDPGRTAKLLDSIYYQMPIGSLFLWEIDRKSANLIRQSTGVLPPFNTNNKQIWFVIDGQQRLSVIYQAFKADVRQNDAGRVIDFGRLCLCLNPGEEQERPQRIVYRKPVDREFVALQDILARDWLRRMRSYPKWFVKKIQDCRDRFLNYPLPIVTVGTATLDEIGDVFIRINSQGMRITNADRAIALMGELDVSAMAGELRHRIGKVFALNSVDPILMGFNLVAESLHGDGDPPKLEAMARRWSRWITNDPSKKALFEKQWHRFQTAFLSAAEYLHNRFPVHDESYLPSENMLATLAVFFYHHPGQPDARQTAEIRKWFWATGLAKRYSGAGYHRNIGADTTLFESLAGGARRRFVLGDLLDSFLDIQGEEYNSGSARARTFFCLLAARHPKFLDNGEPIFMNGPAITHANRRHRHHVFPQAQLRQHFPARVYNSLCNICFLVSADNLRIGMRLPRRYLAQYRDAGRTRFQAVMRSHLIPAGADSGVWERGLVAGFKKFRQQRLTQICAEFEKAQG